MVNHGLCSKIMTSLYNLFYIIEPTKEKEEEEEDSNIFKDEPGPIWF